MSRARFREALDGLAVAYGVTWLQPGHIGSGDGSRPGAGEVPQLVHYAADAGLDFCFVPSMDAHAHACVAGLQARDVAVVWAVPGPMGMVGEQLGWPAMLRATADSPESLLAALAEALHRSAELLRLGTAAGVDAVVIADDIASTAGWLVSPDFALSAVMPCATYLANEARSRGVPAFFHSDGDIRALYGALAEAGYTGVHLASVADPAGVAASAARHGLRTMGGIMTASLASLEEVGQDADAVVRGMDFVSDDGGIASPRIASLVIESIERLRRGV